MKKIQQFMILLAMAVTVSLLSCRKDGYYNPGKKIQKIYTSSEGTDMHLRQVWFWNENLVDSIEFYDLDENLENTEKYHYDNNRLVRVDSYNKLIGQFYYTYEYEGKYLKSVCYYRGEILGSMATYSYNKGKLDNMAVSWYRNSCDKSVVAQSVNLLLKPLGFNEDVLQIIDKYSAKAITQDRKRDTVVNNYYFTWDGNNVSKIEFDGDSLTSISYQYDRNKNPYYGFVMPGSGNMDMASSTKNNVVSMNIVSSNGSSEIVDYSYQYEDNYPIVAQTGNNKGWTHYEYR